MTSYFCQHVAPPAALQRAPWSAYLLASLAHPFSHVRPVLKLMRGNAGIGDGCIRIEAVHCLWRVPALLFAVFVAPSWPFALSILFGLAGRIVRVSAMRISQVRGFTAPNVGDGS
ncbi:hypothetical protein [Piscinibacter sp.]|jgi:hypothetical protein|uniref:hypothetical protein n=1 Tax=Piscinibacter sp. TaxID=1903157 RepID=UPI003559B396